MGPAPCAMPLGGTTRIFHSAGTMLGAKIASRCSGRSRLTRIRNSSATPRSCRLSCVRHHDGIKLGALAHDRLHRVDVVGDQVRRHLLELGRVLDDAAQALGGGGGGGEAESGGVALDVVGGAEQLFAIVVGKAVTQDRGMRGRKPVGLDRHPVLEFARQAGERLFGARDGIVGVDSSATRSSTLRRGLGCVMT